jgi:tetratricopeptide (TPR) repeat protein
MKKFLIIFFLIGLIGQTGISQSADKKLPITTSSEKARELIIQARDLKENIEYVPGDELLKKAIELDPNFAQAHLWLYTRAGTDKAMELIALVTPGEACKIRAQAAAYKGDTKLACQYADSLVILFPKDPSVLYDAGGTIMSCDKEKGMKLLEKAIVLDPKYAPAYNILGYYYMYAGNMPEAGKALSKYLELRPKSGNGHDSYGDFLQVTGKYTEAMEHYQMAIKNEPTLTVSLVKIGWMHIRKGEFTPARESFREFGRAAINDTERLDAMTFQALTSYIMTDMKQAFTELDDMKKKAAELKNQYYQIGAGSYKGLMTLESGNAAGAIPHFRKNLDMIPTLGLDSTGASAQNMYNRGFLCMALASNGQLAEAQKELTAVKQIFDVRKRGVFETNFMNLFEGVMELNRKNYQKAIELMKPGAELSASVPHQYYIGLAYDRDGKVKKAIEYYTMANASIDTNWTALYLNKTKKRIEELKKVQ